MWNLFVFGEKFTDTQEISKQLAAETGFNLIEDKQVIERASQQYGMGSKKLSKAIYEKRSPLDNITHTKQRAIAYLRSVLANSLADCNAVYVGLCGHLLPRELPQIYRIFITAEANYRVQNAFMGDQLPEKKALQTIHREDKKAFRWCRRIYNNVPWDADAYHHVLPTHILDKETAAQMVLIEFQKFMQTQATTASSRSFEDFKLAAEVEVVLAEKGYPVSVRAKEGRIFATIEKHVLRLSNLSRKVTRTAMAVPGVREVTIGVSPNFNQADLCCHTAYEIPLESQLDRYEKIHADLRRQAISALPAKIKREGQRPVASGLHIRATN